MTGILCGMSWLGRIIFEERDDFEIKFLSNFISKSSLSLYSFFLIDLSDSTTSTIQP